MPAMQLLSDILQAAAGLAVFLGVCAANASEDRPLVRASLFTAACFVLGHAISAAGRALGLS